MIWFILIVLALIVFFVFRAGARYRTRRKQEAQSRLAQRGHAARANQTNGMSGDGNGQSMPAPHDSPSLLYADRKATTTGIGNTAISGDSKSETAISRVDADVGKASNQSTHTPEPQNQTSENAAELNATGTDSEHASIDANQKNNGNAGIAAAGAVGVAGALSAAAYAGGDNKANSEAGAAAYANTTALNNNNGSNTSPASHASEIGVESQASINGHGESNFSTNNQDIDLELGDSTHNEIHQLDEDDHDELLDFGDLTADISEMLKELNLRETDSPRLELNDEEFAQLKTGEPGDVKPEKIENVAGKLRNMLQ